MYGGIPRWTKLSSIPSLFADRILILRFGIFHGDLDAAVFVVMSGKTQRNGNTDCFGVGLALVDFSVEGWGYEGDGGCGLVC